MTEKLQKLQIRAIWFVFSAIGAVVFIAGVFGALLIWHLCDEQSVALLGVVPISMGIGLMIKGAVEGDAIMAD